MTPAELVDVAKRIPPATLLDLTNYRDLGFTPGGFLYAVLTGDLFRAFNYADKSNRPAIPDVVEWVVSALPPAAYGSPERVNRWIAEQSRKRAESPP